MKFYQFLKFIVPRGIFPATIIFAKSISAKIIAWVQQRVLYFTSGGRAVHENHEPKSSSIKMAFKFESKLLFFHPALCSPLFGAAHISMHIFANLFNNNQLHRHVKWLAKKISKYVHEFFPFLPYVANERCSKNSLNFTFWHYLQNFLWKLFIGLRRLVQCPTAEPIFSVFLLLVRNLQLPALVG